MPLSLSKMTAASPPSTVPSWDHIQHHTHRQGSDKDERNSVAEHAIPLSLARGGRSSTRRASSPSPGRVVRGSKCGGAPLLLVKERAQEHGSGARGHTVVQDLLGDEGAAGDERACRSKSVEECGCSGRHGARCYVSAVC